MERMTTRLNAIISGLDEFLASESYDPWSYLGRLQQQLQELAENDPSQLYDQDTEVEVKVEWGFRYRLSDNHHWTKVAICTRDEAIQSARDLRDYTGEVTVEIMRRAVMTAEWRPQDMEKLAMSKKKEEES